jgi:hypothetical protein
MTLPASGAISLFDVNDELGLTRTAQLGLLCTNVRTLFGDASGAVAMFDGYGKSNTSVPGAPTGVSASATSCSAISVSFSAPACTGHLSIDYYQVVCTGSGSNSATGASSPISVTGLSSSASYTFKVRAHNSKGYGCYSSSTGTATTNAARGSATYTTPGCYTFNAPSGVSRISTFAVGGGGGGYGYGGGGGSTGYRNNWPVSSNMNVHVGSGGNANSSSATPQTNASWVKTSGGAYLVCAGQGGNGSSNSSAGNSYCFPGVHAVSNNICGSSYTRAQGGTATTGGGGAGGYGSVTNGNIGQSGGLGWSYFVQGSSSCATGRYGGGGAGASYYFSGPGCIYQCPAGQPSYAIYVLSTGGGGGGVGLCGQGSNGSAGSYVTTCLGTQTGYGGGGGSGGSSGGTGTGNYPTRYGSSITGTGGTAGSYGGGSGGGGFVYRYCKQSGYNCCGYYAYWLPNGLLSYANGNSGASGAVVILWPGNTRTYPSTDVVR